MDGNQLAKSPCDPAESTLTLSVVPDRRSRTKMSNQPFVSPDTRFVESLSKAT
jgi:hypothetical protein